ncbi:hypothetical protein C8F04DRAFT_1303014 [Mycena alexandri]|uniref:Uncharacterized protein n=1 Tax=Mycena alexandri TaxID=1745969 RepID=A0AAD6WR99_9AGAR|nr:hypothetical protein C8F04DRAFT_1303014 [Mycena alexandri]
MQSTTDPVLFDGNWQGLVFQIVATCVEIFFYGLRLRPLFNKLLTMAEAIFLVLFIFAIHALVRQNAARRILLTFSCAMILLGTAQIVLLLRTTAVQARLLRAQTVENQGLPVLQLTIQAKSLKAARNIIFAINNLTWDVLLLYRCYMIWGCRWKIVVVPAILIACTLGVGLITLTGLYSNPKHQYIYISATIANFSLMILTEKIKQLDVYGGSGVPPMYCEELQAKLCALALMTTDPAQWDGSYFALVLTSIGKHLINILPMLIILRVGRAHDGLDAGESRKPDTVTQRKHLRRPTEPPEPPSLQVLYIEPSEDKDPLARSEV